MRFIRSIATLAIATLWVASVSSAPDLNVTELMLNITVLYINKANYTGPTQIETFVAHAAEPGVEDVVGFPNRFGVCTWNSAAEPSPVVWSCTETYELSEGSIMTAGLLREKLPWWNGTMAIVGGTGKYMKASGESKFSLYVPSRQATAHMMFTTP